ncbi:hypothetical protein GOP47_0005902 [Adiantum capillus-veneris]|uniref:SH2 domain-containing protein n=1 Tax=Adiantum capillus-veneris TaxID=13818 RepID=A0A9D4V2J7_ADICA|nr:hypothetical protein GOP47_0005902 [Adiantum capillus-veneris]
MRRGTTSCGISGDEDYWSLDELCLPLSSASSLHPDGSFTLCLWIYFLKSAKLGPVLRMVCSNSKMERTLLTLDHNKFLTLSSWNGVAVSAQQICPMEKWVHIGCEFGKDVIRLHMDGLVVAETSISRLEPCSTYQTILVMGGDGHKNADCLQGYAHYVQVLPQPTVTNHYVKHPPLELSLDGSTGASDDLELEEGGDGIWSVVGGKASCRRNFSLDVVLLDALGRAVHKDMEIIALLVYADNGVPVEKPKDDSEAPLLTTFDGVEFPSTERPIKLLHGRASFKLKISQLSSKCDNRLFRVCFDSLNPSNFPFLRVFSRPIRCVSRNRNSRVSAATWKRPHIVTETSWPPEETTLEIPPLHPSSSFTGQATSRGNLGLYSYKRPRFLSEVSSTLPDHLVASCDNSTYSTTCSIKVPVLTMPGDLHIGSSLLNIDCYANERVFAPQTPLAHSMATDSLVVVDRYTKQERHEEDNDVQKLEFFKSIHAEGLSDFLVFKYSLENTRSRAAFLRGVATCWSDQDLLDFSQRVSRATSCKHTGHQIVIAKKLINDGNEAWNQIQRRAYPVPWNIVVEYVERHFQTLSGSKKRCFSSKDKSFLRHLTTCNDYVRREDFDRLWYWIYPVSLSMLNPRVQKTWEVQEPKCILVMVSRQEVEASLTSQVLVKPGTFILRFVSTCSWPHPDAGGLIVSYIGSDLRVHHKLVSLDLVSRLSAGDDKPLSELISGEELMQPSG